MSNILEMAGITKEFPGVRALDHVDFSVKEKEIHGLIGENGAGKSTLMNVLIGLYKPDEGKIKIRGNECTILSPAYAISKGIGIVPQELNLNPFVSATENIFLGNEIKNKIGKIQWRQMNKNAAEIMQSIGVDIDPTIVVSRLSVANQQMIQLARALATGADLLIFDEPTASLTAAETDKLLNLMRKLKEGGKSLIFISHRLEELLDVTDRITVMRDGRLVDVNPTSTVTKDDLIEKMAGKKVEKLKKELGQVSSEVILKVEHLTRNKEFEDISFEVKKGEIFGIGGLVGSKRTELMSAVFGITMSDSGKVFFEGKEVEIKSPEAAIKLGMGYVPEERRKQGIFPIISVKENMVLPLYKKLFKNLHISDKIANEITNKYIDGMGIKTPSVNTQIRNLSGGNQQKVILARWMAKGSKLIILDEPTRGIDVNAKSEIYNLIRELTKQGVTIVIISSEHEELLSLTDEIMIMHEGKQKGIFKTSELSQQDILEIALK